MSFFWGGMSGRRFYFEIFCAMRIKQFEQRPIRLSWGLVINANEHFATRPSQLRIQCIRNSKCAVKLAEKLCLPLGKSASIRLASLAVKFHRKECRLFRKGLWIVF